MSRESNEEEKLRLLLQEQAEVCQEYCNAQTLLHNSLLDSRNGRSHIIHQQILVQVSQDLSESIENVQENLRKLSALSLADRNKQKDLKEHVVRSKRVLQTIFDNGGKLHPIGIPINKDNIETKTVALATLRASIAQVEIALTL